MEVLPQNKWQFAGLVLYVVADAVLEYFLGKSVKIKASSKLELMLLVGSAAVVAVTSFIKKGKKDDTGKP